MKIISKLNRVGTSAMVLMLGVLSSPAAFTPASYTFGSGNDGPAGFTQSTIGSNETWSTQTDSVRYTADDTGFQNFSFLRQFALDRSPGQSYTITASLTWNTYADDNNRIGIYMFGDSADLGVSPEHNEQYALGFVYNADNNRLRAVEGIDEDKIYDVTKNGTPAAPTSGDIIDYSLTFEANIDFFAGLDGTNYINVECIMTDNDGVKTTNSITPGIDGDYSGVAEEWTGDWFGFVGRGQNDRDASGDEIFVADIESFAIVPEPSAVGLFGVFGAALVFIRHRARRWRD